MSQAGSHPKTPRHPGALSEVDSLSQRLEPKDEMVLKPYLAQPHGVSCSFFKLQKFSLRMVWHQNGRQGGSSRRKALPTSHESDTRVAIDTMGYSKKLRQNQGDKCPLSLMFTGIDKKRTRFQARQLVGSYTMSHLA